MNRITPYLPDADNIDVPHGCLECVNAKAAMRRANEAWHNASESERIAETSLRKLAAERLVIAVALSDGLIQRHRLLKSADWQRGFDAGWEQRDGGPNMLGVLFLMMCAFLCGGFFVGTIMACCG